MKRRKPGHREQPKIRNWVAKVAHRFHKAVLFEDQTVYRRKPKHRKTPESWPIAA